MATKSSNTGKTTTKTATKSTAKTTPKTTTKRTSQKAQKQQTQLRAVLLLALGALLLLLAIVKGSSGWLFLHNALLGIMGIGGYIIGIVCIYVAVMSSFEQSVGLAGAKLLLLFSWLLMLSAVITLVTPELVVDMDFADRIRLLYTQGSVSRGGGVISIIFALPLLALGVEGGRIVGIISLLALTMLLTGTTVYQVINTAKKPVDKIASTATEGLNHLSQKMESHSSSFKVGNRKELTEKLEFTPDKKEKIDKSKKRLLEAAGVPVVEKPVETSQALETFDPTTVAPTVRALRSSKKMENRAESKVEQKAEIDGILQRLASENMAQLKIEEEKGETTEKPVPPVPPVPPVEVVAEEHKAVPVEPTVTEQPPSSEVELPIAPPPYIIPPITLLNPVPLQENVQPIEELKENAQLLVDTLMSFGVSTRIIDIVRGPAVTRYELQPAAGVKISKITNLADDIALNLAAAGVRIEAPIPNKPAVGIEIPNKKVTPVTLREVLESQEFKSNQSPVTVAMGRDISGNVTLADIAKMPHALIAGATGSGKSVCINSLVMSILFKARPDEVKLLMIDPKVVELGIYNGLPHLLVPVVTDPKKAAGALGWAVSEMLTRYKLFAAHSVRSITGFNALCEEQPNLTKMPQIVIIIDELSDLMKEASNDVENAIWRLAQMARAAGMHLVIATQRPSVDVITGVIKANIPSRIAFAVSSQIDSRTILDASGAEKLLGMGDMLFYPSGAPKPQRVQGCYVSDKEIERVVDFIKKNGASQYDEQVIEEIEKQAAITGNKKPQSGDEGGGFDDGDEELIDAAISYIVDLGSASTSMLQRKLKLGYARAARIIDELEARGFVGPFEGSKPRSVLISREQYMEMKLNKK